VLLCPDQDGSLALWHVDGEGLDPGCWADPDLVAAVGLAAMAAMGEEIRLAAYHAWDWTVSKPWTNE